MFWVSGHIAERRTLTRDADMSRGLEALVIVLTGAFIFGGTVAVTPFVAKLMERRGVGANPQPPVRKQLRLVGMIIGGVVFVSLVIVLLR